MPDLPPFDRSTYVVLGLGKSGLAAAQWLEARKVRVLVWDDNEIRRDEALEIGLAVTPPDKIDWPLVTALCLSPGIPHSFPAPHPVAAAAKAAGVPILGDIELLARSERDSFFVGITGTNGKSTTTALIGHILKAVGHTVAVGGNLGTAALTLPALGASGGYVLELSSYQLELNHTLSLNAAVLLNISPDHLDRHGGMAGYVAAKRRIFNHQTAEDTAVIGVDDEICRAVADDVERTGPQRLIRISSTPLPGRGVSLCDGVLIDAIEGNPRAIIEMKTAPALPGLHNAQNAAAAYAATRALGADPVRIAQAMQSFPGLAHRQERIATIDGVLFVDDSKATNADATRWALGCYDNVYWIAGGISKSGGIIDLAEFFPRIRRAYLIGQCAAEFAGTLAGAVPHSIVGDLASAVEAAFADALRDGRPAPIVLLSPAAASFDQYTGFEARGDHFRSLVRDLGGGSGK